MLANRRCGSRCRLIERSRLPIGVLRRSRRQSFGSVGSEWTRRRRLGILLQPASNESPSRAPSASAELRRRRSSLRASQTEAQDIPDVDDATPASLSDQCVDSVRCGSNEIAAGQRCLAPAVLTRTYNATFANSSNQIVAYARHPCRFACSVLLYSCCWEVQSYDVNGLVLISSAARVRETPPSTSSRRSRPPATVTCGREPYLKSHRPCRRSGGDGVGMLNAVENVGRPSVSRSGCETLFSLRR